jgi:hypothetical protein
MATPESRERVRLLSSFGVSRQDIAKVLHIGVDTLCDIYMEELHIAAVDKNAAIAHRLYDKAMGGDTTAMIFWLKCRARWREVDKLNQQPNQLQDSILEVLQALKGAANNKVVKLGVGEPTLLEQLASPAIDAVAFAGETTYESEPIQEQIGLPVNPDVTNHARIPKPTPQERTAQAMLENGISFGD